MKIQFAKVFLRDRVYTRLVPAADDYYYCFAYCYVDLSDYYYVYFDYYFGSFVVGFVGTAGSVYSVGIAMSVAEKIAQFVVFVVALVARLVAVVFWLDLPH